MSTKIEWAEAVWNPVSGCSKVSKGCKNCYAEVFHRRLQVMLPKKYKHGFFEQVDIQPDTLKIPATWKKPTRVFVNSMSDLFHKDVPFDFILKVFKTMCQYRQHRFLILTKRPEIAIEFFQWMRAMAEREQDPSFLIWFFGGMANIQIGVSVEDQESANKRLPLLLHLPVMHNFVSCEPMIGPVDLSNWKETTTLNPFRWD